VRSILLNRLITSIRLRADEASTRRSLPISPRPSRSPCGKGPFALSAMRRCLEALSVAYSSQPPSRSVCTAASHA
jgi:hypothetical protein